MSPRPLLPADVTLDAALTWGLDRNRQPTAAHPLCTCREHDHNIDRCPGTNLNLTYQRPDGSEYTPPPRCLVLNGIEPSSRDSCAMHGRPS